MALFKYSAKNLNGDLLENEQEFESEEILRKRLIEDGYYILTVKRVFSGELKESSGVSIKIGSGKVKKNEFFIFCRQFAIILNSGINIVEAVEILTHQTNNNKLKETLKGLHEQLMEGIMLSSAMGSYKDVFPDFFVSMIQVGEISGTLDSVLNRMAEYYEKEHKVAKKIKSASLYPIIVMVIALGVITLLMLKVLPMFSKMLSSMGGKLPFITQLLMGVSNFMVNNFIYIVLTIIIMMVAAAFYKKSERGKYKLDGLKLKLPIIKDVVRKSITSKFSRSLSLLLKSGIPIIRALEIMSTIIGNKIVEEKFKDCCIEVKEGKGMAVSLENMNLFPPMLVHMVSVGERTGELDDILDRTAVFFEDEVDEAIDHATTLIEPIMIVFLAVVVGIVLLAVMLPMTNIMQSIKSA